MTPYTAIEQRGLFYGSVTGCCGCMREAVSGDLVKRGRSTPDLPLLGDFGTTTAIEQGGYL